MQVIQVFQHCIWIANILNEGRKNTLESMSSLVKGYRGLCYNWGIGTIGILFVHVCEKY
jgi:hypothetical protein